MGQIKKKPKINGINNRMVRSFKSCFQFLRSMAKRTPIPDTKNRIGIRQIFIRDMNIHRPSSESSFWIKKIIVAQGWKLTTTWYTISRARARILSQSMSYRRHELIVGLAALNGIDVWSSCCNSHSCYGWIRNNLKVQLSLWSNYQLLVCQDCLYKKKNPSFFAPFEWFCIYSSHGKKNGIW